MRGTMVNKFGEVRDVFAVVKRGEVAHQRLMTPWQPPAWKKAKSAGDNDVPADPPEDFFVAIPKNSEWTYLAGSHPDGAKWTELKFDDKGWKKGQAPFGYSYREARTVLDDMKGKYSSIYMRHEFEVEQADYIAELGLMIKQSDNELAAKFSQQLGLSFIRGVLDRYALYDAKTGGGIWLGKHYGKGDERVVDPVGGHSHTATVRQLLRFYLLLEQDKLVSAAASAAMRDIFRSPDIPHKDDKFVAGLAGHAGWEIRRKAGWWEDWNLDTAVVSGPERHYIIVAMTHHAHGEEYLRAFAAAVDDLLSAR